MCFVFRSLLVSLPALRVICECKLVVIIYLQMKHMCTFPKEFKLVFFPGSYGNDKLSENPLR